MGDRALPAKQRIWNALRETKYSLRYERIATAAGCSVATVRKQVRAWAEAGLVTTAPGLAGQYGGAARILGHHRRRREAP